MKIRVNFWSVVSFVMVVVTSMCFTSCGNDDEDDDKPNELVGWYLCNNVLLTKDNWPKAGGIFKDKDGVEYEMWSWGNCPRTIHIVDDTHLDFYQSAQLYDKGEAGTEGMDMIYQIDGGKKAAYGIPKRLTYNRRTDGGIDFSLDRSQIILAKTETGFEVTSGYWQGYIDSYKIFLKYDPNKAY